MKIPPVGTIVLLLVYLCFVLALEFYENDVAGAQYYTALGVRAGWLAIAQMPLLILLVGKNNLISLFTGVSYERLNVLHRWVARMMLLLVTLHFGYLSVGWDEFGLTKLEWATDTCPPTGMAAYAILLWINLSTLAPFRNMAYEFFVVQHIITFFGFIIAVAMHIPTIYARVYIYIPVALYLVDRLVRSLRLAYNSHRPGKAFLEAQEVGVTKIRVRNHQIKSWSPGSHVLLSLPRIAFGQNHPATIVSTPTSHNGDLIFLLKSKSGFTNRLYRSATSSTTSAMRPKSEEEVPTAHAITLTALIDGPYPLYSTDFAAFDSLILVAASTGVTFTLSHLLSIADRAMSQKLPLRRIEFVWIIRDRACTSWIKEELSDAHAKLVKAGIYVAINVFVTCAETLSGPSPSTDTSSPGCTCAKSSGDRCCCSDHLQGTSDLNSSQEASEKGPALVVENISPASPKKRITGFSSFCTGRPVLHLIIGEMACQSMGEMAVAVCGPLGLNETVRNTVVRISNDRAVHKGTGAQGIYLHVEAFAG